MGVCLLLPMVSLSLCLLLLEPGCVCLRLLGVCLMVRVDVCLLVADGTVWVYVGVCLYVWVYVCKWWCMFEFVWCLFLMMVYDCT